MKKRLRKKLEKKKRLQGMGDSLSLSAAAIGALATECWRLRKTASRLESPGRALIEGIAQRTEDILKTLGAEIEDWTGRQYHEGLTASVLATEPSQDLGTGVQEILDTIVPAVYHNGRLIQPPQIIVGIGGRNAAQND